MGKSMMAVLAFAFLLGFGAIAPAAAAECKEAKPGLLKQAKVTCQQALKTALGKVAQGKVRSSELEVEHGKLVWSFDLVTEGKDGVDEVQIDARTGAVVSVEHETKAQEAAEAKAEAAGKPAATKADQ